MRSVTYSMGMSLDGYVVGPDGEITAPAPDDEIWQLVLDEIRGVDVHLMGRRLYETMLYWESADQAPTFDAREREWAALWNPLPKVVFSTTLSAVRGQRPPGHRWPGRGDRAIASGAGRRRHRDRRRDARRRGGRAGPHRRVPGQGLPDARRRWHSVLPPARAPGGARARRVPQLRARASSTSATASFASRYGATATTPNIVRLIEN